MKDILIIAHFTQVPGEKGNGRFHYLAKMLADTGMEVEVVTSNFSHKTKQKREISKEDFKKWDYKIALVEEPGYKKNVSLGRFYSHYVMVRNLKIYLKDRQ